jgi:single-strand DNA-binding protein
MKKCTLVGRLGKDARLVDSKNGSKFVSFTMAVNSYMNGTEKTTWFDVISFNFSEKMVPHLTKGSAVEVFGDFDTRLEMGNDGKPYLRNDVRADWFDFARGTSQSGSTRTEATIVNEMPQVQVGNVDMSDEIPMSAPKRGTKTVAPVEMNDDTDLPF